MIEHVTKDHVIVVNVAERNEESQSDSDSDEELCVTEMKKKAGGLPQLYAEAFNVAITRFAQKYPQKKKT